MKKTDLFFLIVIHFACLQIAKASDGEDTLAIIKNLRERNDKLEDEIEKISEENVIYKKALSDYEERVKSLEKLLEEKNADFITVQQNNEQLKNKYEESLKEISNADNQVQLSESRSSGLEQQKLQLQSENVRLTEENKVLEKSNIHLLEELNAANEKVQKVSDQNGELVVANQEVAAKEEQLEKGINTLQNRITVLEVELNELTIQKSQVDKNLNLIQEDLDKERAENISLTKELQTCSDQSTKDARSINDLESRVVNYEENIKYLNEENNDLKKRVKEMNDNILSLTREKETTLQDLKEAKEQINILKEKDALNAGKSDN